jgi:hypothetical protein
MAAVSQGHEARKTMPLMNNAAVSEVFTDDIVGLSFTDGNLNLTFATIRADHSQVPTRNQRVVSSRLVMPVTAAFELHQLLGRLLAEMESKGALRKVKAAEVV